MLLLPSIVIKAKVSFFKVYPMNYLDAERTRYQNQDRYATSPEASGQETRAFRPDSWFLSLGSLRNQIIKTLHPRQSR